MLLAELPNEHLIGSVRDNIADIHMETGQPQLALPLYTKNLEFYKQSFDDRRDNLRLMHAAEQTVRASLAINQLSKAQLLFSELSAIYLDTVHKLYAHPPFKVIYLKAQEQLLQAENRLDEAYKTSLELNRLTDSIENAEQHEGGGGADVVEQPAAAGCADEDAHCTRHTEQADDGAAAFRIGAFAHQCLAADEGAYFGDAHDNQQGHHPVSGRVTDKKDRQVDRRREA